MYFPRVSFKGAMYFTKIRLDGLPVVKILKIIVVAPIMNEFKWKVSK
jgi:hypothetical protein